MEYIEKKNLKLHPLVVENTKEAEKFLLPRNFIKLLTYNIF